MAEKDKKETSKIDKEEIKLVNNESIHNAPEDINTNLGKFVNVNEPKQEEDELLIEDKSSEFVNIKNQDIQINFEKFEKKKRRNLIFKDRPAKTKFSVTLETWLQNKRTRGFIWGLAIVVLIILLTLSIAMVITVTTMWKHTGESSYFNFQWFKDTAIAGNIFSYMIIGLCVIPLLYLFITVLVGINGVYKSRSFHIFMWSCYLAAFILLIVCLSLSGTIIYHVNEFTPPIKLIYA